MSNRSQRAVIGTRVASAALPRSSQRMGNRMIFSTPANDQGWRNSAVCLDHDPELWFSDTPLDIITACSICESCPVMEQCRTWATETNQRFGVWGGIDREGRSLTRGPKGEAPEPAPAHDLEEIDLEADKPILSRGQRIRMVKYQPDRFILLVTALIDKGLSPHEAALKIGMTTWWSLDRALYRCGPDGAAAAERIYPRQVRRTRTVRPRQPRAKRTEPVKVTMLTDGIADGTITSWDDAVDQLGYAKGDHLERMLQRAGRRDLIKLLRPDYRTKEEIMAQSLRPLVRPSAYREPVSV